MNRFAWLALLAAAVPSPLSGCSSSEQSPSNDQVTDESSVKQEDDDGKADTSIIATILDFEFDGELVAKDISPSGPKEIIEAQLQYTIGHLNADNSVGRLDRIELTNIQTSSVEDGRTRVLYHAKMPVAWGKKTNIPSSYTFMLPKEVTFEGIEAFADKYMEKCVASDAHDVDSGSFWYDYRPKRSGCKLDPADVTTAKAKVTVSLVNTTGKFPEYHKVWEDNALNIVAVFGKYEDGAESSTDAGISAYNRFLGLVGKALAPYNPVTTPSPIPDQPGIEVPDTQWVATLADGKTVQVNALLVDNIAMADESFYDRYEDLSTRADLIAYNGHAGLGQNVRALASHGRWVAGQYVIIFMNGCDTYAYVDGSLAQTRARINADDPTGTKYMEIITNAMPAYFASDAKATMALFNGLLAHSQPITYEQIFKRIDSNQVVLVTGEQDNVYYPGYPGGGPEPNEWAGMKESGTVAKQEMVRYVTPTLGVGNYVFTMTGTGDADLYVRIGTEPTTSLYDCRPYRTGSKETCKLTLNAAAPVNIMVRGRKPTSSFELIASKE